MSKYSTSYIIIHDENTLQAGSISLAANSCNILILSYLHFQNHPGYPCLSKLICVFCDSTIKIQCCALLRSDNINIHTMQFSISPVS